MIITASTTTWPRLCRGQGWPHGDIDVHGGARLSFETMEQNALDRTSCPLLGPRAAHFPTDRVALVDG